MLALAEHCTCLQHVCLNMCRLITDVAVLALAKKCHHLRKVQIIVCDSVTKNAMQTLTGRGVRSIEFRPTKDCINRNLLEFN